MKAHSMFEQPNKDTQFPKLSTRVTPCTMHGWHNTSTVCKDIHIFCLTILRW